MVELTSTYVPGFLAFREASFLVEKIEKLRCEKPEIMPQAVLVDGNGILHPKSACSYFMCCCVFLYQRYESHLLCCIISLRVNSGVIDIISFLILIFCWFLLFWFDICFCVLYSH